MGVGFDISPRPVKRQKKSGRTEIKTEEELAATKPQSLKMTGAQGDNPPAADGAKAAGKPKRVRTGCLTCRERHLKCDEGIPVCQNCQKSNRTCKRGVRLNFIDMNVKRPPVFADSDEWSIQFLDESREIASEYKGGLAKYGHSQVEEQTLPTDPMFDFPIQTIPPPAPTPQHQPLPNIPPSASGAYSNNHQNFVFDAPQEQHHHHQHTHSQSESAHSSEHLHATSSVASYGNPMDPQPTPGVGDGGLITDADETFYMQVFVEEVGCWMDSMDPQKHVSRTVEPLWWVGAGPR